MSRRAVAWLTPVSGRLQLLKDQEAGGGELRNPPRSDGRGFSCPRHAFACSEATLLRYKSDTRMGFSEVS